MKLANKGNLSGTQKLLLGILLFGPLLAMAGKWPVLPTSDFFMRFLSLANLSESMESNLIRRLPHGVDNRSCVLSR